MLNIVFPLASSSDLFKNAGFYYPKPLIEARGKMLIEHALHNPSKISVDYRFVFIVLEEDCLKFHLDKTLLLLNPNSVVVKLKAETKGALCSILMAIDYFEMDDEILLLNGDQIIAYDFDNSLEFWKSNDADCGLLTFESIHPRWSYVLLDDINVFQAEEKMPISKSAIAGYYYFKKAKDFFDAAFMVIKNDVQLNGKYFISSVINEYVLNHKKVLALPVEKNNYISFYSPQKLHEFDQLATVNSI